MNIRTQWLFNYQAKMKILNAETMENIKTMQDVLMKLENDKG